MYKLIRPILFLMNPERAHNFTIKALNIVSHIPFANSIIKWCYSPKSPTLERNLFGLKFKNPIGIAAGFDKNAACYNQMANFGYSFIEIGSVTPRPQEGNKKPRCFRLPKDKALINRMGINNNGVNSAANNLKKNPPKLIIAGSLSKNSFTPNEEAYKDFEKSFSLLYDFVDMFVLNISCPNVKNLAKLQDTDTLKEIIEHLLSQRLFYDTHKPILLKLSPDLDEAQVDEIVDLVLSCGLDGIVACNTTNSRDKLTTNQSVIDAIGNGGLSGAPLFERTLERVKYIYEKTEGKLPIIASGGVMTPIQAQQLLEAGASLVEVYTGFIYNGPSFAKKIINHLKKC